MTFGTQENFHTENL
jgi:hypothetical protein